jgi:amino acid transporter
VFAIASGPFGMATQIATVVILMVLGMRIGQMSVNFSGTARLPMVAGWDHLMPGWFVKLHRKYRTPAHSILFVGAITLAFGISGILGVGSQESMQLFQNASGIYYAIAYVALFAIPLVGGEAPVGVKIASISGLGMTLLYIGLSIFPIIEVGNRFWFTAKIGGVVIVGNLIGYAIFEIAEHRRRAASK